MRVSPKLLVVDALLHARTIAANYALGDDLTFMRLKMPGWTCKHMIVTRATNHVHTYAHDRDPRDQAIEGSHAG